MRLWHILFCFILFFNRLYIFSLNLLLSLTLVTQGAGSGEVCGSFPIFVFRNTSPLRRGVFEERGVPPSTNQNHGWARLEKGGRVRGAQAEPWGRERLHQAPRTPRPHQSPTLHRPLLHRRRAGAERPCGPGPGPPETSVHMCRQTYEDRAAPDGLEPHQATRS